MPNAQGYIIKPRGQGKKSAAGSANPTGVNEQAAQFEDAPRPCLSLRERYSQPTSSPAVLPVWCWEGRHAAPVEAEDAQ